MLRTLVAIVFILALTNLSFAQIRATTESGNNVLLFDNGTWQYEEKSMNASAEVVTAATIVIDSSRTFKTEPKDLFYLPSQRL